MVIRLDVVATSLSLLLLTGTASQAALLPEVTPSGQVALPFSHRFTAGGKLVSTPTYTLASGLTAGLEASLRLAPDSDIQRVRPEWEPRITYQLHGGPSPWHLAIATAYNSAAVSADAALLGSYQLGTVLLRGSACGFSSGYGVGGPTSAMGLGLDWRFNDWLTATGDYGGVVLAQDMDAIANQLPPLGLTQAWRVGVVLGSERAQHVELYVTNSHTSTLQGLHRGSDQVQVGVEYQVPLWGFRPPAPDVPMPDLSGVPDPFAISMATASPPPTGAAVRPLRIVPAMAPAMAPPVPEARRPHRVPHVTRMPPHLNVVRLAPGLHVVRMGAHGYSPALISVPRGSVVRWVNGDRISHTATARGLWDSLWKKPGKGFEVRFNRTGTFTYQCKRHPNERGVVRVF
ncbi:MAG TPA: hypothetical protein V6D05_08135 [Stenomitos sp.]